MFDLRAPVGQGGHLGRHRDPGEALAIRVVFVGVSIEGLGLSRHLLGGRPLRSESGRQRFDRPRARLRLLFPGLRILGETGRLGLVGFRPGSGVALGVARPRRQPFVEIESEQPVQEILTRFRLVVEKAGERTLGKDDASRELIEGQAEAVDDGLGHLRCARGDDVSAGLEARLLRRCLARVRRRAPHDAGGRVVVPVERELTADTRLVHALADHRLDELLVVEAGDAPVEGEDHRVDDARLAGAGRADDDEQVRFLEVDDCSFPVGGEPLKLDPLRLHAPPPGVP